MTTITLHFQGDSWFEVAQEMRQALGLIPSAAQPSTAFDFPPNGEDMPYPAPEPDPIPDPIPAPAPPKATSRKPRSTQTVTKAPEPEPAPAPEPEAEPEPDPARDLPSIEALKAIVTQAVRLAQKKEGPVKILELLPDFKTKTGLGFVMEAEDKHRDALAELIAAAGLVPA